MAKIVFMGTPQFAVPALMSLIASFHEVALVISQPDKKSGRGHKLQSPPVKILAQENNIPIYQPSSLKNGEAFDRIKSVHPDFLIVIAYGRILPNSILNLPKKKSINIHASLLPRWRGAAPIQYSLLHGDTKTGVCTMLMEEELDAGAILQSTELKLTDDHNLKNLTQELSELGSKLILKTLTEFEQIIPQEQDKDLVTFAKLIKSHDREVDWSKNAKEIKNQCRAYAPKPGIFSFFRGKRFLFTKVEIEENSQQSNPGEICSIDKKGFSVQCGQDALRIINCQPENKKEMDGRAFMNGNQIKLKEVFK